MTNVQSNLSISQARKRPLSVTLLAWAVLMMALLGWLRFYEALHQWNYLLALDSAPPMLYLALSGLIWGLTGSVLVWGLVLGRSWAPRLLQAAAIIYTSYYWADRLLLADPATIAARWPFAIGLNLAFLALSFGVLQRPKTRQFFHPGKS